MSIYTESGYATSERETHKAIENALKRARNRHTVLDKRDRPICTDLELAAVDYDGRTKWTRALCDEFERRFNLPDSETDFFWFCIADVNCVERLKSGGGGCLPHYIRGYRTGLSGLSYVSMLEPSIYVSSSLITPPSLSLRYRFEAVVSWHCHGIAWGPSRKEMSHHFKNVEASGAFKPIAPPMKGCWAQFIQPKYVGDKLAYMNKTPRLANRIYCSNPDNVDLSYEFTQQEAKCRPGQHIEYFKLLGQHAMDELAFAGGKGRDILRSVKKQFLLRPRAEPIYI